MLLFSLLCTPAWGAVKDSYSWYCKRNSTHTQPEIDDNVKFIEEYGGYYVDKKHSDSTDKVIYLTFDAGYENGNINKILKILKEENVKGSFFILENLIIRNEELVSQMISDGHLVCNHTATHKSISNLSRDELKKELETLEQIYNQKFSRELPKYFRPPEGRFSAESLKYLDELGYKTIFWSIAYADWDNNNQMSPDKAVNKIMQNIHNGAILLLHPTSETNVKILPEIIKRLKADGYRFELIDKL